MPAAMKVIPDNKISRKVDIVGICAVVPGMIFRGGDEAEGKKVRPTWNATMPQYIQKISECYADNIALFVIEEIEHKSINPNIDNEKTGDGAVATRSKYIHRFTGVMYRMPTPK